MDYFFVSDELGVIQVFEYPSRFLESAPTNFGPNPQLSLGNTSIMIELVSGTDLAASGAFHIRYGRSAI